MLSMFSLIVETSDGRVFAVRDSADPALAHAFLGTEVKRVRGEYVPKAAAREILVRRAGCRVVQLPARAVLADW